MTIIEDRNPKTVLIGPYSIGDVLPIEFPYTEPEDIKLQVNNELFIYNVDYTVLGRVLTLEKDIPLKASVTIFRKTPLDQQAEFPQNNKFNSAKLNAALDKLTMQQQEQYEILLRCVTASISLENFNGDLPTPASKQVLIWNENATALENYDIIGENKEFQEAIQEALDDTTAVANEASRMANSATNTADAASRAAGNAIETANNANTKADNAIDTATNANTKADNAVNTANEASVIAVTAQDVANSAINTANDASTKVDDFAEDIEKVIKAAEKIDVLEEVVEEAKAEVEAAGIAANSATTAAQEATQAANSATTAAQEATATLSSKQDKFTVGTGLELVNGVLNNTQTSANWGNITGNIENQIDLKEKFDSVDVRIDELQTTRANVSLSNIDEAGKDVIRSYAGGGSWGEITGDITNQADLFETFPANEDLIEIKAVLIDSFIDGASGYRIWSDGYCEQWGRISNNTNPYTVTFVKTFKDIPNVIAQSATTGSNPDGTLNIHSLTTNSFIMNYYGRTCNGFCWKACGYLAEGEY